MLLALTCYFCWEILYQERVILNILRMSKTSANDSNDPKLPLNSDHLEEVVEAWFEQKKKEVIKNLRSSGSGAQTQLALSKQDLMNEVKKKIESNRNS
jgi:16S rRNA A1518/A1519 N6-dimethyltransferase RsmA/KsgA/DIM1 with predicted DNA glycosylase/AP lyase activity